MEYTRGAVGSPRGFARATIAGAAMMMNALAMNMEGRGAFEDGPTTNVEMGAPIRRTGGGRTRTAVAELEMEGQFARIPNALDGVGTVNEGATPVVKGRIIVELADPSGLGAAAEVAPLETSTAGRTVGGAMDETWQTTLGSTIMERLLEKGVVATMETGIAF